MKKIYGFAFAAAVMALASCSNENEPTPAPTPDVTGPGRYVAINICNPAGTRAEGYEVGTTAENKVTSGTFYIFDKDNKMAYTQAIDPDATWQGPNDLGNTVEVIGGGTLLIPGSITGDLTLEDPEVVTPGDLKDRQGLKVLVVLNDAKGTNSKKVNIPYETTLDAAKKILTDASETESADNAFLMTNSTYYKSDLSAKYQEVAITSDNLVASIEEAKAHPVNIYVERTVARVDYAKADPTDGEPWLRNNKIHYKNAVDEKTLTPLILGVEVVYDPSNSSLFKQFDSAKVPTGWDAANLNSENNFRSFWANMDTKATYDADSETWSAGIVVKDKKYSDIPSNGNFLGTEDWDAKKVKKLYLHENTYSDTPSTVLVYAQLLDEQDKPFTMAALYGQYTDKAGAINMVANTIRGLGYRIQTTVKDKDGNVVRKEYRTVAPSDFVWSDQVYAGTVSEPVQVKDAGNRTYLQLKEDVLGTDEAIVKLSGDNAYIDAEVEDLNAELAAIAISVWESGYCYYYTTIDHVDLVGNKTAGVVRNHLYKINFTGMSGLGTPVFNPDKVIVPVKPKYDEGDQVYLAAQVNVLQWRVATQNTILGD